MKLYFVPNTRSTRPRWLLEELGVPYELHRLDVSKKENHQPEYLDVHPLGHVPALVDGDLKLFESAAICLYLADKYPEKNLAPSTGTSERGTYYQWIVFAMATFEPTVIQMAADRSVPEDQRDPAHLKRFQEVAKVLEHRLTNREFLVGDQLTAADVIMASLVAWAGSMKILEPFPTLLAYGKRLVSRPAAKKAREA